MIVLNGDGGGQAYALCVAEVFSDFLETFVVHLEMELRDPLSEFERGFFLFVEEGAAAKLLHSKDFVPRKIAALPIVSMLIQPTGRMAIDSVKAAIKLRNTELDRDSQVRRNGRVRFCNLNHIHDRFQDLRPMGPGLRCRQYLPRCRSCALLMDRTSSGATLYSKRGMRAKTVFLAVDSASAGTEGDGSCSSHPGAERDRRSFSYGREDSPSIVPG